MIEHSHAFAATLELLEDARRQGDLLDAISDAIVSGDADGVIVSWNSGAERLYGYSSGDAVGCDLLALLATACVTDGVEVGATQMLLDVAVTGRWEGELRERRSDAVVLTVLSSVSALHAADDGTPAGYVFVNRDVTEQRRQEHEAAHDVLTGLPNRRRLVGASATPASGCGAAAARWPCSSWISTGSNRSTTGTATPSATSC